MRTVLFAGELRNNLRDDLRKKPAYRRQQQALSAELNRVIEEQLRPVVSQLPNVDVNFYYDEFITDLNWQENNVLKKRDPSDEVPDSQTLFPEVERIVLQKEEAKLFPLNLGWLAKRKAKKQPSRQLDVWARVTYMDLKTLKPLESTWMRKPFDSMADFAKEILKRAKYYQFEFAKDPSQGW